MKLAQKSNEHVIKKQTKKHFVLWKYACLGLLVISHFVKKHFAAVIDFKALK